MFVSRPPTAHLIGALVGAGAFVQRRNSHGAADDFSGAFTSVAMTMSRLQAALDSAMLQMNMKDPFKGDTSRAMRALNLIVQQSSALNRQHPEVLANLCAAEGGVEDPPERLVGEVREWMDFASAAYDVEEHALRPFLLSKGYHLVKHEAAADAGVTAHFLAFNAEEKKVVIGIKGTSTLADVVTDAVSESVALKSVVEARAVMGARPETVRCHEGIGRAATLLADELAPVLQELFLPQGYTIHITGHSLGAGTACILGLLLRARLHHPFLHVVPVPQERLRVIAVATPPVLDRESALCVTGFTTSVVNHSDIVPRMSVANLLVMKSLMYMSEKKASERAAAAPTDYSMESWRKWMTSVSDFNAPKGDITEAISDLAMAQHSRGVEADHLFVPGEVIICCRTPEGHRAYLKDGTFSALGVILPTPTLVEDHFLGAYRKALDDVLAQG